MKKLLLIFLIFPVMLFAQNSVTGKIVDKKTGKPIELVAIYTNTYGTISNELGEFEFRTDSEILLVNHVSYHPKEVSVTGEFLTIQLEPKSMTMDIVEVRQHELLYGVHAKYYNIFKSYEEQNKRFPKATFYYRQTSMQDSIYTEFMECFFDGTAGTAAWGLSLNQGRYAKISDEKGLSKQRARKSKEKHLVKKEAEGNVDDERGRPYHFEDAYIYSGMSPISFTKMKKKRELATPMCNTATRIFDIKLESIVEIDTPNEIRIYRFTPKKKQKTKYKNIIGGLLHIRPIDSTIVKFEGESETISIDHPPIVMSIPYSKLYLTITYKDYDPIPIVESVKAELLVTMEAFGKVHHQEINTIMYATEYRVDTTSVENREKYLDGSLLDKLEEQKYDSLFWRENQIIKRTPIENKIIENFNRLGYFGNFEL